MRDKENQLDRNKVLDVMDNMFEEEDNMVLGPPPVDEVVYEDKKEVKDRVKNPNFPNLADQLEAFINSVDCGAVNVDNRYSDLVLRGFMKAALADLPQEWVVESNTHQGVMKGSPPSRLKTKGKHYQLIGEIEEITTYNIKGFIT